MLNKYAPILLFVYKRADLTKQAIESLRKNYLAQESELFIFSDDAKSNVDKQQVNEVREYIKTIQEGFAKVEIIERPENFGCDKSIILGVNQIIEKYGKVIVVEDDLIVSANFLDFMNQALDFYFDKNIFTIASYSFAFQFPPEIKDVYFIPRGGSCGWAIWQDRWQKIDWDLKDYQQFKKDKSARKKFNLAGSDMCKMLDKVARGELDAWDIRRCYTQFKLGMLTVYPKYSKVENNGFNEDATHTKYNPNYKIEFDDGKKRQFDFPDKVEVNQELLRQFRYQFSLRNKLKSRIIHYLKIIGFNG